MTKKETELKPASDMYMHPESCERARSYKGSEGRETAERTGFWLWGGRGYIGRSWGVSDSPRSGRTGEGGRGRQRREKEGHAVVYQVWNDAPGRGELGNPADRGGEGADNAADAADDGVVV